VGQTTGDLNMACSCDMKSKLKVKKLNPDAILPKYAKEGDAGLDLCSICEMIIKPRERWIVPTGLAIELLPGYEAQIRPRSGLAAKKGITVLNSPGTVDAGYRGELSVIIFNAGDEVFFINKGDRIAQMVINKFETVEIEEVKELSDTSRGAGGFGSSGLR
jgi:dUTP pyrophosphatase